MEASSTQRRRRMPPVICLLVEHFRARRREIQNLLVVHDDVNHRNIAQIPEIQRQLAARSSVDSGVAGLSRRFLERLTNDELRVPIVSRLQKLKTGRSPGAPWSRGEVCTRTLGLTCNRIVATARFQS